MVILLGACNSLIRGTWNHGAMGAGVTQLPQPELGNHVGASAIVSAGTSADAPRKAAGIATSERNWPEQVLAAIFHGQAYLAGSAKFAASRCYQFDDDHPAG